MANPVRNFARSTAGRAVHLMFTPRPSNIGESREMLRLISQFGEVEYFKSFKYDALSSPRTAVAIFKDEEAARNCMKKSPIRFRLGSSLDEMRAVEEDLTEMAAMKPERTQQQAPPSSSGRSEDFSYRAASHRKAPFGLGQTRLLSTTSSQLPKPPPKPFPLPLIEPLYPPPPQLESRLFQVQTNPARVHFRDRIDEGHYNGHFHMDTKSVVQQDLRKRVPTPGASCVDWRKEPKHWRVMRKERERERSGPERRRSLRELYDAGPSQASAWRDEALPG